MKNNELCHFGILGMHWGVRRFQKPDGSLTSAGKKRHSDDQEQYEKRSNDYLESQALKKKIKKKGINSLSNEELKKYNERAKLEFDYKHYKQGESKVKSILLEEGTKLAVKAIAVGTTYAAIKYLQKKYQITPENLTKKAIDVSGKIAKTTAIETAKGTSEIAKEGFKQVADTHKKIRKSISSTPAARAYVKTMAKTFGWKVKRKK